MSTLQRFSRILLAVVHSEILIPKRLPALGQLRAAHRFPIVGIGARGSPAVSGVALARPSQGRAGACSWRCIHPHSQRERTRRRPDPPSTAVSASTCVWPCAIACRPAFAHGHGEPRADLVRERGRGTCRGRRRRQKKPSRALLRRENPRPLPVPPSSSPLESLHLRRR